MREKRKIKVDILIAHFFLYFNICFYGSILFLILTIFYKISQKKYGKNALIKLFSVHVQKSLQKLEKALKISGFFIENQ